jgi:hypothetical protein
MSNNLERRQLQVGPGICSFVRSIAFKLEPRYEKMDGRAKNEVEGYFTLRAHLGASPNSSNLNK